MFARVKETSKALIQALKDPVAGEIEIADLHELLVYTGKEVKIFKPETGKNGREILVRVLGPTPDHAVKVETIEGSNTFSIVADDFKKGLKAYPVREK